MKNIFQIIKLDNGTYSIRSIKDAETFHPVIGPTNEAKALYLNQLNIPTRMAQYKKQFAIWDVGLGAAANPITILQHTKHIKTSLKILSFDKTILPLEFALQNTQYLTYLKGWEHILTTLLEKHTVVFNNGIQPVEWNLIKGDFPETIQKAINSYLTLQPPCAILYDAYSPKSNPDMWTLNLFKNIYSLLSPEVPCSLATYSRSTMIRVTLLVAGFFVGTGHPIGEKEETTIAANRPELIDNLLDKRWLLRAKRSTNAEPMTELVPLQKPLTKTTLELLLNHPQFNTQPI